MHVHVHCGNGEAKFWLEPKIELAVNYGLSHKELHEVESLIENHCNEIREAWRNYFGN